MSLGAYREPVKVPAALAWRGNELAARHELSRERQSTLELGASVIGVSLVLAAFTSVDMLLALSGLIAAAALAGAAWLLRYGLATRAPYAIEVEGTLEQDFLGGFRVHAGDQRYRLFPVAFRHGYHVSGPVKARVLPAFGAAIAWAEWPEWRVSNAARRAPITASDRPLPRIPDRL